MKFDTFECDGKKYAIEIQGAGQFSADVGDLHLTADTYEKLKDKIRRATRKAGVRISILATLSQSDRRRGDDDVTTTLVEVEVTGLHQRTGAILIRRGDNGRADTVDSWRNQDLYERLTPAQQTKMLDLGRAKLAADKALETFKKAHRLDADIIKDQVRKAERAAGIEAT